MEVNAKLRFARISPQKARLVADQVRGMPVDRALEVLSFSQKKSAAIIKKILDSAIANAENNDNQKADTLYISTLIINKWIVYKRWNAVSRGRSHPILKRTSNIKLELQVK